MSINQIFFPDFVPAEVKEGKICRIVFYSKNPQTQQLERHVVKCNRLKDAKKNLQLAKKICFEINSKLNSGWSPYIEREGEKAYNSITEASDSFLKEKKKELRPDGFRSYNSLTTIFLKWLSDKKKENTFVILLKKTDAIAFLDYVYNEKNVSSKTYNNYLRFFKTLWNWMIEKGYCKENIFADLKFKKVEETDRLLVTDKIREQIKEHLEKNDQYEFLAICMLCFQCFLRDKEICMLKVKDIDLKNNIITVLPSVSKTAQKRTIGIPRNLREFFLFLNYTRPNDYVFSTGFKQGSKLKNTRDIGKRWNKLRTELRLPEKLQFYSLKHTGITEMLESGAPAKYVQELAGHHSLEMTERYKKKSSAQEILKHNNLTF